MSKALDIAELIRTRLITAPATGELETPCDLTLLYQPNADPKLNIDSVIVDRQMETAATIGIKVGKSRGTCIVIRYEDISVQDANAKRPFMNFGYGIRIYSKPVISADDFPADEVLESVVNRLWHWVPVGTHQHREAKLQPGGEVPDRNFLIYELGVLVPASH